MARPSFRTCSANIMRWEIVRQAEKVWVLAIESSVSWAHHQCRWSVCSHKVESLVNWSRPTNVIEIRSFMILAGYYRRFVKDFSKIATPLTQLTRKNVPFEWNEKRDKKIQILKNWLVSTPILALPFGINVLTIYSDASHRELNAFWCNMGKWLPMPQDS